MYSQAFSFSDTIYYWGILRVVDANEESGGNGDELRLKSRTFELYKLNDRWAAANGPTARVPHYMYTFGPDTKAKLIC